MSVDPAKKNEYLWKRKVCWRRAFEKDACLPEEILWREKAAFFSDAVGHSMVDDPKEYAQTCYEGDEWKEKCSAYEHAAPFTKESLLLPKSSKNIIRDNRRCGSPGFWMR